MEVPSVLCETAINLGQVCEKEMSFMCIFIVLRLFKSKVYYTRGITPKCVRNGGVYLRSLAPEQRALKKHRSGGETLAILSNLTGSGIEHVSGVFDHYANRTY